MCHRRDRACYSISIALLGIYVAVDSNLPQTVDGPAIDWTDCGLGVPELGLEELAAGVDEAAAVWGGGAVVA
jgi:hypothetical protein